MLSTGGQVNLAPHAHGPTIPSITASKPDIDSEDVQTDNQRESVYLDYVHKDWVAGCLPHPGRLVESASLAAVDVTLSDYTGYDVVDSLPPESIRDGKLSSLQLESVMKAAHRHRVILVSGERAGFFIGDAAGVGKGRQIAAIMTDNFSRGRLKHVWFSVSTDLIIDAKRDFRDIGSYLNVIDGCQEIDRETKLFGLSDSAKTGCLFSTYSTLVSTVTFGIMKNGRRTRLDQLVNWCGGEDFDGCLVFDECHKAKNFIVGNEANSSKVAMAVCEIQKALPKARVVYCSATGISDVKNMAFMTRLGLWGQGAAFSSYEAFLDTVQKKGLGIAEMLAMDMKREGIYVSRMLSYNDTEFRTEECKLNDEDRTVYNRAVQVWNEIRRNLATAIKRCRIVKTRLWVSFWAAHQRFFQQLCISMKIDAVVSLTKQALDNGKCVVIGLQNTGEANLEQAVTRQGGIYKTDRFVSACREILINFVTIHFPTLVENNTTGGLPLPTVPDHLPEDEWCVEIKRDLLDMIKQLQLPDTALDVLIDKLGGVKEVAEMTGRKARMVRKCNGNIQYELRQELTKSKRQLSVADQSLNVKERSRFMNGKKLIAVISDAASTGISLHADRSCDNQRQRVHVTLQLPWSADKAVQQLGRSHRSNQVCGPVYVLLTTELGGERRFAASVARRLQSLGALTKGDRRATSCADLSEFNYDTQYGRTALKLMYKSICEKKLPGDIQLSDITDKSFDPIQLLIYLTESVVMMGLISQEDMCAGLTVSDNDSRDVPRFLNRILGLQVFLQNTMFKLFTQCLELVINIAKKEGKFNEGFVDLMGSSIEKQSERIVFPQLNTDCRQVTLTVDRGMTWSEAVERFNKLHANNDISGFYRTKHAMNNVFYYMLITPKEDQPHQYRIARPNTGVTIQEVDRSDIKLRYVKITQQTTQSHWNEIYDKSLNTCNHGEKCNQSETCQVGMRRYTVNVICGSLLRLLPLLEEVLLKHSSLYKLHKYESTAKVVRVCLDSGERLIGFQFPSILMGVASRVAISMAADKRAALRLLTIPGQTLDVHQEITEQFIPVIPRYSKKAFTQPPSLDKYFTKLRNIQPAPPPVRDGSISPELFKSDTREQEVKGEGQQSTARVQVKSEKNEPDKKLESKDLLSFINKSATGSKTPVIRKFNDILLIPSDTPTGKKPRIRLNNLPQHKQFPISSRSKNYRKPANQSENKQASSNATMSSKLSQAANQHDVISDDDEIQILPTPEKPKPTVIPIEEEPQNHHSSTGLQTDPSNPETSDFKPKLEPMEELSCQSLEQSAAVHVKSEPSILNQLVTQYSTTENPISESQQARSYPKTYQRKRKADPDPETLKCGSTTPEKCKLGDENAGADGVDTNLNHADINNKISKVISSENQLNDVNGTTSLINRGRLRRSARKPPIPSLETDVLAAELFPPGETPADKQHLINKVKLEQQGLLAPEITHNDIPVGKKVLIQMYDINQVKVEQVTEIHKENVPASPSKAPITEENKSLRSNELSSQFDDGSVVKEGQVTQQSGTNQVNTAEEPPVIAAKRGRRSVTCSSCQKRFGRSDPNITQHILTCRQAGK